ncbi:MAG: tRNA (guanosine(46)-N7)-methyltransferase TrmB [Gammaproteobacteria bacterium]|nr:tRNA (guanosine(46)-N7)-methyltransferase TrmB [Gammaproteobacteria bacterium]
MPVDYPRKVRSFVRRPGRTTTGQRRALDQLLPVWGIPDDGAILDLDACFGRSAPHVLDIGFGDGEALLTAAAAFPDIDYLGIEVHEPGIGHLLAMIKRAGVGNIRIINGDAVEVVDKRLAGASFDAVNLFFPDPWPKKRHHKRRIVQADFVVAIARILRASGLFHFATDWRDYDEQATSVIGASGCFDELVAAPEKDDPLAFRAPTKFERRGLKLGHTVVDRYYRKRNTAAE